MADIEERRALAGALLEIGAVHLSPEEPFTWASGLRAPIYCDNRLTLGYPEVRARLAAGFVALLRRHGLQPEGVVGTATAGIPHAAWLADRLALPLAYARSKPKEHGRGNLIEGVLPEGARVVVVEDLISTGGSSVAVVEAVRAAGASVVGVLAIFSYGLPAARERFAAAGVPVYALTDFAALVEVAAAAGRLSPASRALLEGWQRDPAGWSAAHAAPAR